MFLSRFSFQVRQLSNPRLTAFIRPPISHEILSVTVSPSLFCPSIYLSATLLMTEMASNLLKIHIQTTETRKPQALFPLTKALSVPSLPFPTHYYNVSCPSSLLHKSKISDLCVKCSLSSSTPPTTKEAAIHQAKTCLSTTLEKPLNNVRLTSKLRKLKQPRFRLEIPVIDDSPASLSQLALEVFRDLPMKRKGSHVNILIVKPSLSFIEAAVKAFESYPSDPIEHVDISSLSNGDTRILNSADVTVFLAPEASQLAFVKTAADSLYPRPSEWYEDLQRKLEPIGHGGDAEAKVEHGFLSIYTSKSESSRYNKSSASEQTMKEITRLVQLYRERGEEVSLTITGHSLGGALAHDEIIFRREKLEREKWLLMKIYSRERK